MKFNRLRLLGFKSFVEPSEFVIERGLTGVVGPNGCGKSNLVEALRWVMGESSYKNMRASGMDDVIFSGSATRPSRNTAEVTLFLDNADRTAPAAFNDADELQVSRRIEREAGSIYRINGKEARAKDVQLLFADQSTGARSPSMVGQGRIGELIQAKPQARRALLEEAAGISGLHSRRHEAELRLRAAEQNLERLDDVVGELESQIENLKRQARQASRFKNLSADIRKAEATLLHLRWTLAKAQEAEAKSALAIGHRAGRRARSGADERGQGAGDRRASAAGTARRRGGGRRRLPAAVDRARPDRGGGRPHPRPPGRARQAPRPARRRHRRARSRCCATMPTCCSASPTKRRRLPPRMRRPPAADDRLQAAVDEAAAALTVSEAALAKLTAERAEATAARSQFERCCAKASSAATGWRGSSPMSTARPTRSPAGSPGSPIRWKSVRWSTRPRPRSLRPKQAAVAAEKALAALRQHEAALRAPVQEAKSELARVETEARTLAKILNAAAGGLFPAVLEQIKVERGYETALGAALGEDLDIPLDRGAPAHWAAASRSPAIRRCRRRRCPWPPSSRRRRAGAPAGADRHCRGGRWRQVAKIARAGPAAGQPRRCAVALGRAGGERRCADGRRAAPGAEEPARRARRRSGRGDASCAPPSRRWPRPSARCARGPKPSARRGRAGATRSTARRRARRPAEGRKGGRRAHGAPRRTGRIAGAARTRLMPKRRRGHRGRAGAGRGARPVASCRRVRALRGRGAARPRDACRCARPP